MDLDEDSPFDRPTIIPSHPPEEYSLLAEAEGSAILLRKDRLAPSRLPSSLEIPPSSSRRPSDPEQRRLGLEEGEIDMWGGGSRVPTSPSKNPRGQLPTLHEDDPLAFDLRPPGHPTPRPPLLSLDDLSLDLDSLSTEPVALHPTPPRRFPIQLSGPSGEHDDENAATTTWRRPGAASAGSITKEGEEDHDERPSERRQIAAPRRADARPEQPASASPTSPPPASSEPRNPDLRPERAAPSQAATPTVDMRDRFAVGDFTGALIVAEGILESEPSHSEAAQYAENCRDRLRQMYAARLGSLAKVPRVSILPDQVRWLSLDHRAGFILSCVDGCSSIDEILDVSGMPPLDALRILFELLQQRVISVG